MGRREPEPLAVLSPATGRPCKAAPAGRREIKPTGGYHFFRQAIERAGATEFCAPCYCYVLPGHTCPSWTLAAKPARPTMVVLEGGLTAEVA